MARYYMERDHLPSLGTIVMTSMVTGCSSQSGRLLLTCIFEEEEQKGGEREGEREGGREEEWEEEKEGEAIEKK